MKLKALHSKHLFITFIPAVLLLFLIAATSIITQIRISHFTNDLAAIVDIHPFFGVLSNLGILGWCVSTSVCFFLAVIFWRVTPREIFCFLASSGALSLYLLLDDFFLFHEHLAVRYLNLHQNTVLFSLGVAVLAYIFAFKQVILRTQFVYFLLALGFFAVSILIDMVEVNDMETLSIWKPFAEDGAKWLGIVSWCSYYVRTGYQFLTQLLVLPQGGFECTQPKT